MAWPTKEQRKAAKAKEQPVDREPVASPELSAIMARLEALETENAALKAKQPQFVPMARPDRPKQGGYVPPEALQKRDVAALHANGQQVNRQVSSHDDPAQYANMPQQFRPAFVPGMQVTLNPDAPVWGMGGSTWGSVREDGRPVTEIVGEVLRTQGRTRSFEPKYRVRFPGLTRATGGGFRESELMYA